MNGKSSRNENDKLRSEKCNGCEVEVEADEVDWEIVFKDRS